MNLAQHLVRAATQHAGRPALAVGDQVVASWAQMQDRVARLAGGLTATLGLKPGDRVILSDMSPWDSNDRIRLN